MLDELYRDSRSRVTDIARSLSDEQLATIVAGSPEWTGHDVVAHLAGVSADIAVGNLEGAPGPQWTAVQVAARTERSLEELLAEWAENGPTVEKGLEGHDLGRPAVFDVLTHEADLRETFRMGMLPPDAYEPVAFTAGAGLIARFDGVGSIVVNCMDAKGEAHEMTGGAGGDRAVVTVTAYELFRAALSRRSRRQMLGWGWSGDLDPTEFVDRLPVFGPREDDQPLPD